MTRASRIGRAVAIAALIATTLACTAHATKPRPPVAATTSSAASGLTGAGTSWRPSAGATWQYQLTPIRRTGPGIVNGINLRRQVLCPNTACPAVFGIDLWVDPDITGGATNVVNAPAVRAIHAMHARAICYFSGGTLEAWRPDAQQILTWDKRHPAAHLLSKRLDPPYGDERWFNVKAGQGRLEFLAKIMETRISLCADNGFDGADPDWADGWLHNDEARWIDPITAADQLRYNRMMVALAHKHHLAIALKNDSKQAAALAQDYDLAVIEDCHWNGPDIQPCAPLASFTNIGKPVLQVEYLESDDRPPAHNPAGTPTHICAKAVANPISARFDTIVKKSSKTLQDLPWTPCPHGG